MLLDEASFSPLPPARQQSSPIRRLPPHYPTTESTRSAGIAHVSEHRFERLPDLHRVATAPSRAYAIDLTEKREPTEKAATLEPVIPKKRFVAAKAPKPPLPQLTQQAAAAPSGSAGWLMTGTSLVAVSQRADGMIERGFLLAEKGAYFSAQTEFQQALRTVAQALDAHFGGSRHSEALAAGWLALEEAGDFSAQSQRGPVVDVGLIVESHQTPVLKDYNLKDVSPVLATQHYFVFAQEQLVEACGRAPVASRGLHGLGKIHMVLGEKSGSAERLHGPKAMAFQQAALTTDPGNFLAANELGVLLARFGKLPEARAILQHSVATYPLPETWQNLSVVHQRLGEEQLAAQSLANWQVALQQAGGQSLSQQADSRSMIQWVSPQAFAGPQPGSPYAPSPAGPVVQPELQQQAKQKSGFLWW
jgi:tetratricopeptide (TPR) repeat protein